MNKYVKGFLESFVEGLDDEIDWHRKKVSELAVETDRIGKKLYELTTERRAILEHLEVHEGRHYRI